MTPELEALARRAVACEGWRWMKAMRGALGSGRCRVKYAGAGLLHLYGGGVWSDDGVIPDLSDFPTKMCLLALAREAWNDPGAYVVPVVTFSGDLSEGWRFYLNKAQVGSWDGPTEAHALVAALEAAPSRNPRGES